MPGGLHPPMQSWGRSSNNGMQVPNCVFIGATSLQWSSAP
eukprot:CAMPEP_0174316340 /NCGR_PEP_ID=MMETSP0810-20121108/6863_1 /TAXON_ID=73025 ORGANISM="Eutreptiella gymnastica-like, Strain CCMP1594" /NCGR_SAMPLE_ID=MMETSP0810 /ASSEMBLY_ACC=CAM_ASM_000659 /LENGTH=39 /DNA_ID= /DNA_START= /DNA_END= /DNA_ORIENTATION=